MSDDCDTSSGNGHKLCSIPYTGTYNTNEYIRQYIGGACTGCVDPSCYENPLYCSKFNDPYGKITRIRGDTFLKSGKSKAEIYIHKGPKNPFGGGYIGGTDKNELELPNMNISYPTNEELKENIKTVILGVEFIPDNIFIGRISGIYYCDIKDILKKSKWKGYNEGAGLIDLFEYNRQDIDNDETDYKGTSQTKESRKLFRGSYADSVLAGVWYKMMRPEDSRNPLKNIDNGNPPVIGICLAFKRFFGKTNTEYFYFDQGSYSQKSTPPSSDWFGSECLFGEFISQLELYYTNFDKSQYLVKQNIAGINIASTSVYELGVGFKGFGMYRSVNYFVKDGVYDWIPKIDSLTCCQLLSDKQYEDDTVELLVCREHLDYKITNDFPNSFPNQQCKNILSKWCGESQKNEYYNLFHHIQDRKSVV